MNTILMLSLFLFTSCASFKKLMNSGMTHQKMAERLEQDAYDMDIKTLKDKVIVSFNNDHDSPMIILPMDSQHTFNQSERNDRRQEIEDAMKDQGFSYRSFMYKNELDFDWPDFKEIKSSIKTGPFHVVEDAKEMFMIVKGIRVYKGESIGNGKTRLSVTELTELKRDPMQIKMNWFKVFTTRKIWFSLNDGPISLEKSLLSARRDKLAELSMLHYLDQEKFLAWEKEETP